MVRIEKMAPVPWIAAGAPKPASSAFASVGRRCPTYQGSASNRQGSAIHSSGRTRRPEVNQT
jgi:hypothetical protein